MAGGFDKLDEFAGNLDRWTVDEPKRVNRLLVLILVGTFVGIAIAIAASDWFILYLLCMLGTLWIAGKKKRIIPRGMGRSMARLVPTFVAALGGAAGALMLALAAWVAAVAFLAAAAIELGWIEFLVAHRQVFVFAYISVLFVGGIAFACTGYGMYLVSLVWLGWFTGLMAGGFVLWAFGAHPLAVVGGAIAAALLLSLLFPLIAPLPLSVLAALGAALPATLLTQGWFWPATAAILGAAAGWWLHRPVVILGTAAAGAAFSAKMMSHLIAKTTLSDPGRLSWQHFPRWTLGLVVGTLVIVFVLGVIAQFRTFRTAETTERFVDETLA